MFKGIKNLLAAIFIAAFFCTTMAFAQTTTATPKAAEILPPQIDILYEFNNEVTNPMTPLLDYAIQNTMGMQMEFSSEPGTMQTTQEATAELNLVKSIVAKNILTFAFSTNSLSTSNEPYIYLTFKTSDSDFSQLLSLSGDNLQKADYRSQTYYYQTDMFMARLNGLVVMTNNKDNLLKCIDNFLNTTKNNLASDTEYISAAQHASKDNFFSMYIRASFMSEHPEMLQEENPFGDLINPETLKTIVAEYVSITQHSSGFDLSAYVKGNLAELQNLDLVFNKYVFTPVLYKQVSGTDLIAYTETNKFISRLQNLLKVLSFPQDTWTGWNEMKAEFKTNTGVDIDADILPLLNNGSALFVHKTAQLWPAVTLIFDTRDASKTSTLVAKLVDYLKSELDKEEKAQQADLYSYSITSVNGTPFYTFKFNLAAMDSSLNLPSASQTLTLSIATPTDGTLILSNHPDLTQIYKNNLNGLMNNAEIAAMFTSPDTVTNGVGYFSFDKLHEVISALLVNAEAPAEIITFEKNLLAPWHDMFSRDTATADTVQSTVTVHVDVDKFSTYESVFKEISSYYEELAKANEIPLLFPINFTDVPENAWFHDYVFDMAGRGIIKGYEDNTFRPNNYITRAEFITMLMRALGKAVAINSSMKPFNDVTPYPGEWYSEDVIMASYMGYIKGYDDGTFRPNSYITRAEAIQIAYNASNQLKSIQVIDQPLNTLINFSDVGKDDWFMPPVAAGYHYGIINGVTLTTFEPNRNITRAEAAKIIKLVMDLETL